MRKLYLMGNPYLFQGEKYLKKNKNYFEGWYFKNTSKGAGISFIPGINITDKEKKAFIQVITNDSSYFINYNLEDFKFNTDPFYIMIGDNFFSKDGIHINIKDKEQNLRIRGDIKHTDNKNIKTSLLSPNIMGPFSYIPFMECNHAIISMQNNINGMIKINSNKIKFNNGRGYIEKDFGTSFPKSYVWCEGNNFKQTDASFMLSVADIPFKLFHFRGLICVLLIDEEEYKFTTYNNAKVIKYEVEGNSLDITLKKGKYYLDINSVYDNSNKLSAPVKGNMSKDVYESINAVITVTLRENDNIIFSDTSINSGLEIV